MNKTCEQNNNLNVNATVGDVPYHPHALAGRRSVGNFTGGSMLWHERLWRAIVDCAENVKWWIEDNAALIGGYVLMAAMVFALCVVVMAAMAKQAHAAEVWKVTAYCSCAQCCGKTDGITASGKQARYGMIACNWLPFGTKVKVGNMGVFTVADRGAKSLFGSKSNHIRHIDVFLPSHAQARMFGVRYLPVEVLP